MPQKSDTRASIGHVLGMVVAPGTALRALKLAQGDTLLQGQAPNWFKLVLTYVVPYGVSTWTSIAKDLERAKL